MKTFDWSGHKDLVVGRTDSNNRTPNYTKKQVAERLLQANDKVRRSPVYLNERQTIVVMVITSNLLKMEMEY